MHLIAVHQGPSKGVPYTILYDADLQDSKKKKNVENYTKNCFTLKNSHNPYAE